MELQQAQIPFARERKYEVTYKGVILPHHYDVDFGADSLEWKHMIRTNRSGPAGSPKEFQL